MWIDALWHSCPFCLKQFAKRKQRREYTTSSPKYEYRAEEVKLFSYPRAKKIRILHHGTPFVPTVFSNVCFPAKILPGDPIAGADAPHFVPGVFNAELPNAGLRFQHIDYRDESEDEAAVAAVTVAALREAPNLPDQDE